MQQLLAGDEAGYRLKHFACPLSGDGLHALRGWATPGEKCLGSLGDARSPPSPIRLAGLWLATQQFSLVCRHFDFGPLSAAAAPLLNSMTPIGRSAQPKVPEVDVT